MFTHITNKLLTNTTHIKFDESVKYKYCLECDRFESKKVITYQLRSENFFDHLYSEACKFKKVLLEQRSIKNKVSFCAFIAMDSIKCTLNLDDYASHITKTYNSLVSQVTTIFDVGPYKTIAKSFFDSVSFKTSTLMNELLKSCNIKEKIIFLTLAINYMAASIYLFLNTENSMASFLAKFSFDLSMLCFFYIATKVIFANIK